jgi:hypothetical protein
VLGVCFITEVLQFFKRELKFLIWYSHVAHMVYVFSPRHIFMLSSDPTSNGICRALGRIKDVAYLPCVYCKVKTQI